MIKVAQILSTKDAKLITVDQSTSVLRALQTLSEHNIGALPVVQDKRLVGIFSERDYARKVVLLGKNSTETLVSEIMSERVFTVHPDSSVEECMRLMSDKRIRHLPVLSNNELMGILSIGDVVKTIIKEQMFQIEQLETYIKS